MSFDLVFHFAVFLFCSQASQPMTRATASFVTLFLIFSVSIRGSRIIGDAHLIFGICLVNASFHASSREPCRTRRNKRCHPVQQEKQAKVTLEPEEATRWGNPRCEQNSRKSRGRLRCSLRKGSEDPGKNGMPSQCRSAFLVLHEYKRVRPACRPITAGPAAPFFLKVANWRVTGFNPKCRTTENSFCKCASLAP